MRARATTVGTPSPAREPRTTILSGGERTVVGRHPRRHHGVDDVDGEAGEVHGEVAAHPPHPLVTARRVDIHIRAAPAQEKQVGNVLNSEVARDHREMFEADLKNSKPLTLEEFASRPFYIKWADRVCGLVRSQL